MGPGDVIGGRFEIERLAARGGMGSVYRARDLQTGQAVAIKVGAGPDDAQSRRWDREATLLAQVSGPGVVRYLAHGREPTGDAYLVMEWLEGEDLAARLEREGVSLAESLALVAAVATALRPAHAQGIAHRDVKPSNIFLLGGDLQRVRVIDFGIARVGGEARSRSLHGTPGYVAPEQARGDGVVDARADVFALGCVLFECLTGRPAFLADNVMALLAKVLLDDAPRPGDVRPGLPLELDELVARMLAKDPARRPADAAAVVAEIGALRVAAELPRRAVARGPSVLTKSEQRLVFVVLMGGRESPPGAGAATLGHTLDEAVDIAPEVRALARAYGATAAPLADGSTVLVLEGATAASDPVEHAAITALALRAMMPGAPIALATGRAAAGDRLPLGDVIDRASELVRRPWADGGPGRPVLIDGTIAALLEARFQVGAAGGCATLLGHKPPPGAPRTLLGVPTACVGRDRELDDLESTVARCATERSARGVLVTAPAGMGKSRLLHELLDRTRRLPQAPDIWMGRGDPMHAGAAFGLLGQVVRGAIEVHDNEPLEVRRARIGARVRRHVPARNQARVSQFLGELAGAPFPDEESAPLRAARGDATLMRDQLVRAWTEWLAAEAEARPILLVLEDVHWGDLPSLLLVDAALRTVRDGPWMVLALGRPDVHDLFPRLWVERRVNELRLDELTPAAAEGLVRRALASRAAPEIVERIVARGAGVPFYLEELARAEVEGRATAIPESILAVLQARLERLAPETRRVLRAASIFGGTFPRAGVVYLCGKQERVREALAELEELEFVQPSGDCRLSADTRYAFRHALVREAAYVTLTDDDRSLGHRLAGQWLEENGEPDAMTLAEHHERSKDAPGAVRWFRRAAEQALDGYDLDAAISRADRGVACGAEGEALGALRLVQSEAHLWRGDLGNAERDALVALRELPRGGARWYKAALGLLMQNASLGREDQVERFISALGEPHATERSGAQTMAFALALRLLAMRGKLDLARSFLERLSTIDRDAADQPAVTAMVPAGIFYWWSYADWDPWARLQSSQRCARECEAVGDVLNMAMARIHVGWALVALGAFEDAEQVLTKTLAFAAARGMGGLVPDFAQVHLGAAIGHLGRTAEARGIEQGTISRLFGAGNWLIGGWARAEHARLLLAAGEPEAAEEEARAACGALSRVPPARLGALALHASALLARGEPELARDAAGAGAELLERLGCAAEGEPALRLALARALAATGRKAEADRELRRAADRLRAGAARIPDETWRRRFLDRVPEHAAILQLAPAL